MTLTEAARALILAQARLDAFDKAEAGTWRRNQAHDRRGLVRALAAAELAYTEASLADERASVTAPGTQATPRVDSPPAPQKRPGGRPGWKPPTFYAVYREARDRAGGPLAPDKAIAAEMAMGLQQFQRLVRRFGRPE